MSSLLFDFPACLQQRSFCKLPRSLWRSVIPPRRLWISTVDSCVSIAGLPGGQTHALVHGGRSTVGMGRQRKPLICIKTSRLPPQSQCSQPPPLPLIQPNVLMHARARSLIHISHLNPLYKPSLSPRSSLFIHLFSTVSNLQPQKAAQASGWKKRKKEKEIRRLLGYSWCNPVLLGNKRSSIVQRKAAKLN